MTTYLDAVLDAHRRRAAADRRDPAAVASEARSAGGARPFAAALRGGGLSVIAEVKRRSPSLGDIAPGLSASATAAAYANGGASCLSVLTDSEFFGGSPADLAEARSAVGLPVLRKDFTVSALDVCDARLLGADAVLLIVAALDDPDLGSFLALAGEVGLDALVEVHDEAELERALSAGATLVGVNQRDLVTFEVDTDRAVRVGRHMPDDVVKVAESGVRGPDDARRLADAGFDAVLVGESLVRSDDPAAAVRALCRAGVPAPAAG
ncbi:MAG TPA: indole-3-glycerol phosphate synthase TrpC [Acidimicrobiales bacterium]|nr:indole-3-glycerol phosphate synthase TrpC [Acidimicrobiales bacterium]